MHPSAYFYHADCTPPCVNGMCNMTVGECGCDDGYIGDICNTCEETARIMITITILIIEYAACPIGRFGVTCAQNCSCLAGFESSPCDHVDGTCHCLPGYTGPACELSMYVNPTSPHVDHCLQFALLAHNYGEREL